MPIVSEMMRAAGDCLMTNYASARREGWEWFEADLSYDNARLCEGLLKAGEVLGDREMVGVGLATLDWLVGVQTGPRGSFRPVGSNGFARPYSLPLAYDQQPLEAAATMHLSELTAPEGVTFLDDPEETIIATVTVPTEEPEEPEVEEETALVGCRPRAATQRC